MTKEEKIKWLQNIIVYHKKLYYTGNVKMSDRNYDAYEDDLRKLDPNNDVLSLVGYSDGYILKYFTHNEYYSYQIPYFNSTKDFVFNTGEINERD